MLLFGDVSRGAGVATAMLALVTASCSYAPAIGGGSDAAAAPMSSEGTVSDVTSSRAPSTLPAVVELSEVLEREELLPLGLVLERSGLDDVLAGLDEFVLLAPTHAAFAAGGDEVGVDFFEMVKNPRLLDAVMRYHIVANPAVNVSWRTLNGATLDVSGSDPALVGLVDGVEVVDRIRVRSGTVLVVERVLLPRPSTADAPSAVAPGS